MADTACPPTALVRAWKFKQETEHLRRVLEEEVLYRKQLEAMLRENGFDPAKARSIQIHDATTHRSHLEPAIEGNIAALLPPNTPVSELSLGDIRAVLDKLDGPEWQDNLRQTLRLVSKTFKPGKPVEIRFQNVTWSVTVKGDDNEIPTVGGQLIGMIKRPLLSVARHQTKKSLVTRNILHDISGVLSPQQMTLVLGGPGSGKTSFLKLIAGNLPKAKIHRLHGKVTFNGDQPGPNTFNVRRVVAMIDQHDTHLPTLTVLETLNFAAMVLDEVPYLMKTDPESRSTQIRKLASERNIKVRHLLAVFGLDHVQETLVGDELVRGVSGGQKKRVTICEKLVGFFRVVLGDQISTGLDSSTTHDIVKALRFATDELYLTTAISLLQPPPEVFNLFDNLIVFHHGQIIYQGAAKKVIEHFGTLGFSPSEHQDTADFLQEVTVDGSQFWQKTDQCPIMARSADDFVDAFRASEHWKQIEHELAQPPPTPEWKGEMKQEFMQSWTRNVALLTKRQFTLLIRNVTLLRAQVFQSLSMGLLTGSLFYQLNDDEYANRYGLFFLTAMMLALGAMPALPTMCAERTIFYKQRDANFFSTSPFIAAQSIAYLPVNIVQTLIFGTLMWWMCGLTEQDNGSRYASFLLVTFLLSLAVTQLLRTVAAFAPNAEATTPMSGCLIVFMILFSGFIIREDDIPDYWIWIFWLNPIAWSIRAFALLEFKAPKYDALTFDFSGNLVRKGDLYLEIYGFRKNEDWVWWSLLFLTGLFISQCFTTWVGLEKLRHRGKVAPPSYGQVDPVSGKHIQEFPLEVINPTASQADSQDAQPSTDINSVPNLQQDDDEDDVEPSVLPFTPVTLAFENLWYTVKIPSRTQSHTSENLDLLQGVTGFARPGTMTALMGSSGAGKTTLLDVISGRKTGGTIKGDILINGRKKDRSFSRIAGYVEQMDIHSPHSTVIESLMFSARLRLPSSVDANTRTKFVEDVTKTLELHPLRNALVGKPGEHGLTTEQRKRLTIGVELVANPSIVFLDEPTSGLDSRAAAIVMRVARNITASKRTIVCTIHQPSAYLFGMFDNLLLLKKGGKTVYFGPLGSNCVDLVSYLGSIPGAPAIQKGANPATYMLEVIGAGTTGANELQVDPAVYYKQSALCAANASELQDIKKNPIQTDATTHMDLYAVSFAVQASALIKKSFKSYWRSPNYNVTRMLVSTVVAFVFGSVYTRGKITSQADVVARFSVIFVACAFTAVVYCTSVIEMITTERAVFYRERAASMYSSIPYTVSFTLAEVPYIIFNTLIFSVVFYFTVGLYDDAGKFFYFWLYYMLIIANATFAGQMCACLTGDSQSASVLATLVTNIWFLFCGFMLSPGDIPDYWSFLYWLDPFHYLMEGIVVTQFHGEHKKINALSGGAIKQVTVEEYVYEHFGGEFKFSNRGTDIIALCVFIIGFNVIRALALKYLNFLNR